MDTPKFCPSPGANTTGTEGVKYQWRPEGKYQRRPKGEIPMASRGEYHRRPQRLWGCTGKQQLTAFELINFRR
ncbi:unnamed protein product [Meloidogyne enterolobii]|uniref:Uncharacterized protein n=1 Tax=Meloidogyne enterolobii TaxID=390850 RepID=A0ACB1B4U1_MELEN